MLHTNLGRARLAAAAVDAVVLASTSAVNLEYDLERGERGRREARSRRCSSSSPAPRPPRSSTTTPPPCFVGLNTLASGKEVVVSRGELVEIGGAFRMPDIVAKSGAVLREVGTTNRTHPQRLRAGDRPNTGSAAQGPHQQLPHRRLLVRGRSAASSSRIGRSRGVPVMEDLGSGALVDLSRVRACPRNRSSSERVAIGADIVTFSGDKVLGGPQAGLVVGRARHRRQMRGNPLHRAVRCGKLTLAALEATLRLYQQSADLPAEHSDAQAFTRPLAEMAACRRTGDARASAARSAPRFASRWRTRRRRSAAARCRPRRFPRRSSPSERQRVGRRHRRTIPRAPIRRSSAASGTGGSCSTCGPIDDPATIPIGRRWLGSKPRTDRERSRPTAVHWIIGTAGHIDHGKTSLVKALTGQDTDRLKEEKERGISIDLGFAHLDLPDGMRAGVVDVPGHERFIRNMLAGAHGMDLVLFTVAADDGVMPQTEEHLDILHLLGVDARDLRHHQGRSGVAGPGSRRCATRSRRSRRDRRSRDRRRWPSRSSPARAWTNCATRSPTRCSTGRKADADGRFRLPVDRVFILQGHGLIVTGTALSGSIAPGDRVRALPGDGVFRVRSVEVHTEPVERRHIGDSGSP